ncbi:MobC family plasmid mobilization relaxosome protein [Phenylobacterium sp. J367]|uniref:MobC family plasmid mobilization relaxosome protein n=1 Tax=Phenylobacterium sp. J367 TaxID=2898435 RepID=UPI00215167B1|nr:MobC family plasmid mobilization relaxosome protein [Phenylobacterium sp. J367]MCR5879538.1 MobC family plasmid mobilization relaxosome protein [Phenylobacterium sp. J367]
MPVLSTRVPDETAARFDAAAAAAGGRSALLRRLVDGAAGGAGPPPAEVSGRRDAMRLMVRLAMPEARHVRDQAARLGLPRAAWVAALVRRHALAAPRFPRPEELLLVAVHGELRRIGVNVNQIARALNTAVVEGRVLELELDGLEDFRRELRAHVAGLGEAFAGNLAYWAADL